MQLYQPPLAFMGNKRNMVKHIKQVLQHMQSEGMINDETIFLDIFGGSGLISHNIKVWYPQNEVIWNDFDNYQERLDNIKDTEKLREELYKMLKDKPYRKKLDKETRQKVIDFLEEFQKTHYIDFTNLSNYLLFSGNYVKNMEELKRRTFFNGKTKSPIQESNYLKNVKRVRQDFKTLMDIYSTIKNKVLILDPPYLQTQKGNYKDKFTLKDFFELIERIKKPYIFFGSKSSDIIEAFNYFSKYHADLKGFTYNKAFLTLNSKQKEDFIIYPQNNQLFNNFITEYTNNAP